jgi:DNA replication protein DnaC
MSDTLHARCLAKVRGEPLQPVDMKAYLESIKPSELLPDPTTEQLKERARVAWLVEADRIGVPSSLQEASFGSQATSAMLIVRKYVAEDAAAGRCLLLLGPTGVGKTWAAVAAMRECYQARVKGRWFFYFPALASRLLDNERRGDALQLACSRYFVVFDDLGTEYQKEGGLLVSLLDEIFWKREGNRLPTIITSNLTPEQFKERMSDRIVDRLRGDWGRVVTVPGESLRRKA